MIIMVLKSFSLTHLPVSDDVGSLNILESSDFASVCDHLSQVGADSLSVYTDRSLSNLNTVGCRTGAAAFFEDIDLGLGVSVSGLMSSTLAELQAIALALKSILPLSSVRLFSDNQSALDVYPKVAGLEIVKFVHSISLDFRSNVWFVHAKHHAFMEKYGLIPLNGSVLISVSGLASGLSAGVVKLLGITDAFGVYFGFRKSCLFFSGVSDSVSVHIAV
ncbi:hypothetical protein G9A89_016524 [Geosiphon pyriformis]|nr:hypothetical protein G9A89_016524 [Geosiphon pyriformis]